MKKQAWAGRLVAIAMIVSAAAVAQNKSGQGEAVADRDIQVVDFVELGYPFSDQTGRTRPEGPVVVRANLDKNGRVSNARAIFGNETLATASLANIKSWRFKINATKTVVLVYDFRLVRGQCKTASSIFTLQRPNLVTIAACFPSPAGSSRAHADAPKEQPDVTVTDADVEVAEFEEMQYPRLAALSRIEGVVVVQVRLSGQGEVEDASTVSGNMILAKECLANVRKWHFRPNSKRTAIVVYSFRFPCGSLSYKSEYQHQFVLEPPNFAKIMGTARSIQTQE